jgi:SSS family solute:Na+ symporter
LNLHVWLLLAYTVAFTLAGLWIGRFVRGPADFFVAGRSLPWALVGATVLAANIGAGTTIGAAGLAYRDGLSAWWWNGTAGIASFVLAFWVGPRLWTIASARGYLTAGDFIEDRYGARVRALVALLIWVGTLAILAGQLIAGAAVLTVVADLPRWMGILLGGVAMTIYFTAGGLLSSVWVNAVQLLVLLAGFAIAVPAVLSRMESAGGFAAASLPPTFWDPFYSAGAGSGWTLLLLLGPGFVVSPGLVQKAFGAKDARAVRMGIGAAGAAQLVFSFAPVLIGMSAAALHPGLANRELAMPTVLFSELPAWLGALALAAVFSAEVSTCDAILFMLATSWSKDLYQRFLRPAATPDQVLMVARLAAVAGGVAGMGLAVLLPTVVTALTIFYSLLGAALLVPVIGALMSPRAGAREAGAAIVFGMGALIFVQFGTAGTGWLNPNFWGLVAAAVAFSVSLALRRRPWANSTNSKRSIRS